MPNMSSIIKPRNKKVICNNESKSSKSSCNCGAKSSCPINGNCLQQNVIYCSKAISRNQFTNKSHSHYIGSTESFLKIDYINTKIILGNKYFRKIVKPPFSNKDRFTEAITLIENNEIISDE